MKEEKETEKREERKEMENPSLKINLWLKRCIKSSHLETWQVTEHAISPRMLKLMCADYESVNKKHKILGLFLIKRIFNTQFK